MAELKDGIQTLYVKSRGEWRKWLEKNHQSASKVWLIIVNKQSKIPGIQYVDAVEEALCFGWIDSKTQRRDEDSRYQIYSKRKPKSNWSQPNKERVARLKKAGLITEAGLQAIQAAKASGAWNASNDIDDLIIPPDLKKLLNKNKTAAKNFDAFPRSSQKLILRWIYGAKRPETRNKRVEKTVQLAAENIRANH